MELNDRGRWLAEQSMAGGRAPGTLALAEAGQVDGCTMVPATQTDVSCSARHQARNERHTADWSHADEASRALGRAPAGRRRRTSQEPWTLCNHCLASLTTLLADWSTMRAPLLIMLALAVACAAQEPGGGRKRRPWFCHDRDCPAFDTVSAVDGRGQWWRWRRSGRRSR